MTLATVDLMDPVFTRNPVDGFGRLRELAPIVPVRFPGIHVPAWIVLRYEEVRAALTEPRFVMDRKNVPGLQGPSPMDVMQDAMGMPEEYREYLRSMLQKDGKAHFRLRSLVAPSFTARRMETMRPFVERATTQLMDNLRRRGGEVDLIADFAVQLAGTIISELIGIEPADREEVAQWIHNYSDSNPARILETAHNLIGYTKRLIARRREQPQDDLISRLLQTVGEDGDRLSDAEVISLILLLIHTGHHATSHFIPGAALKMLDHPDQLARLRAQPELLPKALEELLRTASPVTLGAPMYVTEDFEFAGARLGRGNMVTVCLISANHDPRAFPNPDVFDIARETARNLNLSFYHGSHYCLASALARLESEVALEHLLLRGSDISLAVARNRIQYHPNPSGSLLARVPVRLQGARDMVGTTR